MSAHLTYFRRCLRDANLVVGQDSPPLELARQFLHLEAVANILDSNYNAPSSPRARLQHLEEFVRRRTPKTACAAFARARGLLPSDVERLFRYLEHPQRTFQIPEAHLVAEWTDASTTYPEEYCGSDAAVRFVASQLSPTHHFPNEVRVVLYGCAEPSQVSALVRKAQTASILKQNPDVGEQDLVTLTGAEKPKEVEASVVVS